MFQRGGIVRLASGVRVSSRFKGASVLKIGETWTKTLSRVLHATKNPYAGDTL